jgi:short-subunit dehydrogenase
MLTAASSDVAKAIYSAVATRKDVIYVKPVWWWIMTIIRAIPENIFKSLRI